MLRCRAGVVVFLALALVGGVAEGDRVELGNERGQVIVHARPRGGQAHGVVVVEGIWPNRHFEGGLGINALTNAEPGYPNGGAVVHDTAVWVRWLYQNRLGDGSVEVPT